MAQKIFVLVVNPKLNKECVDTRTHLEELLEEGWRIVQATPILAQGDHISNKVTVTNSIIYIIEKE